VYFGDGRHYERVQAVGRLWTCTSGGAERERPKYFDGWLMLKCTALSPTPRLLYRVMSGRKLPLYLRAEFLLVDADFPIPLISVDR